MTKSRTASSEAEQTRKRSDRDHERGVWTWSEDVSGERWSSALIPTGDYCVARVQRTMSRSGITKKYGYYAYRSGQVLGIRDTPEEAMRLAEAGKSESGRDNVKRYVDEFPGDIPPFLMLTEEERREVRAQYPYAAPSDSKVRQWASSKRQRNERGDAADLSDPSTRAYLAELEARAEAAVRVAPDGASRAALNVPRGRLVHTGAPNPKRPGTAAHGRWEALAKAAAAGQTAEQYAAAGGNVETLHNAVAKGFVEVSNEK